MPHDEGSNQGAAWHADGSAGEDDVDRAHHECHAGHGNDVANR